MAPIIESLLKRGKGDSVPAPEGSKAGFLASSEVRGAHRVPFPAGADGITEGRCTALFKEPELHLPEAMASLTHCGPSK